MIGTEDYMIWDMQFGSTGKGLLAGYLSKRLEPEAVVSAWAPNAGHTFIDSHGSKTVRTMLPIGTVSNPRYVFLGPGSVVNVPALAIEVEEARERGWDGTLVVHETASIVSEADRQAEKAFNVIGSTQKGSCEAVIRKMRRPTTKGDPVIARDLMGRVAYFPYNTKIVGSAVYHQLLSKCTRVQIEAAQGYSLSIDHGFYPYTTSRDTSTLRVLADCGWPASRGLPEIFGVARTFPIRVANRFDAKGEQVGWSGPCYADQLETSWEEIGQPVELTTVTKLPRRVFTFSMQQLKEAEFVGGVDYLFLNFMNYLSVDRQRGLEAMINKEFGPGFLKYKGFGPTEKDVVDA
jgi:adenylosuccinate synthase